MIDRSIYNWSDDLAFVVQDLVAVKKVVNGTLTFHFKGGTKIRVYDTYPNTSATEIFAAILRDANLLDESNGEDGILYDDE